MQMYSGDMYKKTVTYMNVCQKRSNSNITSRLNKNEW